MFYKLILTGILASTLMFAQRGGRGGGGGGNMSDSSFGGGSRLDRISEALKLTKDQKKDFKTRMDDAQKEATPVHDQLMKGREEIAEAVAAGKSQDEITKLLAANSVLDAQIVRIELKTFSTFFKGLDKEQQNRPAMPMIFQAMKGIFDGKNWNAPDGR